MPAHAIKEEYYSGQGVVLVARRNPITGKPMGYRPVGNCPALAVQFETTTLEHKESTTGARGTDLRLTTENNCNLNFTLENFQSKNLADAIRGSAAFKPAAAVTAEALQAYAGLVTALERVKVSALVVTKGATPLVAYVNDTTAYDYIPNPEAGSFKLNDGLTTAWTSALAEAITGVTVGATTSLAVANTNAVAGDNYTVRGVTGDDAADLNGKTFRVVSQTSSSVVLDVDTTGKTITATAGQGLGSGAIDVSAAYTYVDQYQVEALDSGAIELALRFEGLNTANENAPVIVEVFRYLTDPAAELALIGDGVQQFVLEGSVLADTTRTSGSKFLSVKKLT